MEYSNNQSAPGEWAVMDGLRQAMINKIERLSQLTIPSVTPQDHYNTDTDQLTNGFTSLGSQASTHLVNKLMMAMFAPSRPFMRLEFDDKVKAALIEQLGVAEDDLVAALVMGEKAALNELEQAGQRQVLFEVLTHLVVAGNALLDLSGEDLNLVGVKDYVVRRNAKGKVVALIVREKYRLADLDPDAQAEYKKKYPGAKWDADVCLYTWVRYADKMYRSSVWVDDCELSQGFKGKWTEDNLPWRALTWRLPARQHYGVGRAEEYANDLAEHESLSHALSDGAALATTFKWLANPGGMTRPEDVTRAQNGAVVPGAQNDISLLFANIGQQLSTVLSIRQDVAQRIGRGFLLSSAVTRDAERVTAEEIRLQAIELESSLGGAYSRLALDVQQPLGHWLLRKAKVALKGTQLKPVIITGLDALSRNADRERMMMFLQDVTALDGIAPATRMRLREGNIIADMAAGAGVDRVRYIASEEEVASKQQIAQQEQVNAQATEAGMAAAANATQE
jgi:hypothetical protein